jgi:uncharacterized membrane protein
MPLHPALVHLPLGLAFALPVVGTLVCLLLFRGKPERRLWLPLVALQAMVVVGGWMALVTGQQEEERVENRVPHPALEAHEARGREFLAGAGLLLAFAVTGLATRPGNASRALAVGVTLMSLGVVGLAVRVGHAGGTLVYVHGAAGGAQTAGEAAAPQVAEDDD